MAAPRPSYSRAKSGSGYIPVDMPVTKGLIAGGVERLRNTGKRKGYGQDNRYHNLMVLQDAIGGAGQIASAPIMGLLSPAFEAVADRYKAYRALPRRQQSVDADAADMAADFAPGASRSGSGQGLLSGGLNPMLDSVEAFGKRMLGGIDNTADDIGYPRDMFRELVGAGASVAAGPAAKGFLRGAEGAGEALEGAAGRLGYTLAPEEGLLAAGVGPRRRRPSGGGDNTTGFDASAKPDARGLLAQSSINMPAGSDPRYRGAAPNRTTEYQRYVPPKETARVQRLIAAVNDPSHPIHARIDGYIRRGQGLGGDDWYNTEEALDWFTAAAGGDKAQGLANWREFMTFMGGTSTGSKVPSNIRNASFYYMLSPRQRRLVAERVAEGGITPGEAARELRLNLPNMPDDYNYGHLMQANHAKNIRGIMDGEWSQQMPEGLTRGQQSKWLQKNPKVKSFGNDLMGAQQNIAADMHYMRILAMSDGGTDFLSKQAGLSAENLAAIRERYGDAIEPYINVRLDRTGKEQIEVNLYKAAEDGVITDTEMFRDTPTAWLDVPNENEYAAVEGLAQRMARNYPMAGPNQPGGRMTAPQFQANLWMGAGDVTGLADESQGTFMELFRNAIDRRAAQLGITREEMFMLFANKQAPLAVAGGVGLGGGLLATQGNQERDPYAGLLRGY